MGWSFGPLCLEVWVKEKEALIGVHLWFGFRSATVGPDDVVPYVFGSTVPYHEFVLMEGHSVGAFT